MGFWHLRGFAIDDDFEPGRLRDWQVGGFLALMSAFGVSADIEFSRLDSAFDRTGRSV
jgi:hypothetical protein